METQADRDGMADQGYRGSGQVGASVTNVPVPREFGAAEYRAMWGTAVSVPGDNHASLALLSWLPLTAQDDTGDG